MRARILAPTLALFLAAWLGSCASAPSSSAIPSIASLDEAAFAGTWYEIARLPLLWIRDLGFDTKRLERVPQGLK